jgi:hypothetical protein
MADPFSECDALLDVALRYTRMALTGYEALEEGDVPLKRLIENVPDKAKRLKAGSTLWAQRVTPAALLVNPLAELHAGFYVRKRHTRMTLTGYEALKEGDVLLKRLIESVPDKAKRLKAMSSI